MTTERHFLNWQAAALPQAAGFLLDRFGADQSSVTVVLPGRRAGRRLLELLVESVAQRGEVLLPPEITTVGRLLDHLCPKPDRPQASSVARQQAWLAAIRQADGDTLREFLSEPPRDDQPAAQLAVAEQLDTLHQTVAAGGHDFAAVAALGQNLEDFIDDEPRWQAMARVQQSYFDQLDAAGLCDPHQVHQQMVEAGRCHADGPIVLAFVVELTTPQRQALEHVDQPLDVLVHAPADRAADFDALGTLNIDTWQHAALPMRDEQIVVADRPSDQADAAVRAIDRYDGAHPAEQITIGVCDDRVLPYLQQRMEHFNLPARAAAGVSLTATRPIRLLRLAAAWLEHRRFADFAALLRHIDIEDHLRGKLVDPAIEHWLTLVDRYLSDHLQGRVADDWLGDPEQRAQLKHVHDVVCDLFEPLLGTDERPLRDWAQPVADVLVSVYSHRQLSRLDEADRLVVETSQVLRGALVDWLDLYETLDPPVAAPAALAMLIRHVERLPGIVPESAEPAVELLGPLELHLDDAAALIVTGFNEGHLPSSITADPFLPDALRSQLGLIDNRRRLARDAYALCAMLSSQRDVTLIAGRQSVDGDPLTPSRLMFAPTPDGDDDLVTRRVRMFYQPPAPPPPIVPPQREPMPDVEFKVPPPPAALDEPITAMAVTAFRSYLECPYRFYLRHVLRLETLDDQAAEMDGGAFGSLAHDVLGAFGQSDAAHSTDADTIERTLNRLLDEHAERQFGRFAHLAVRVQIEQLRQRLSAFATWQADWAQQGWRIVREHVEVYMNRKAGVSFDVDGEPMTLTGRIDRIDVNEQTGACIVFDYKTSEAGDKPDKTHRKRGAWVDLQLPLYRHLVRKLGYENPQLGYILLSKKPQDVGAALATWGDEELASADEEARRVIRCVRGEIFWPPSDPPTFDDYAAICGADLLTIPGADDEDSEGGDA